MNKWIWLGQRLSDGILYSRALDGNITYFTCDSIVTNQSIPFCFSLYSNNTDVPTNCRWTSKDIPTIVENYAERINNLLQDGAYLLPYCLPNVVLSKLKINKSVPNKKVFCNELTRSLQMYLMSESKIRTPKWITPNSLKFEALTKIIGQPFIVQFDKTSAGIGTFLIYSEEDYEYIINNYGEPDIATQFLDDSASCSTHLIVNANGIQIASPSVQIIERNVLNTLYSIESFSFKGNDFSFYDKNIGLNLDVNENLLLIGEVYQKIGFHGILGIDYMVKNGKFFYIETNYRLQNSTALLSFLQPIGNGNIVNAMFSEDLFIVKEVKSGFQYYTRIDSKELVSGYYTKDGEMLSDILFDNTLDKINTYLVLVTANNCISKDIRLIGFDTGCIECNKISKDVRNFIERLSELYG